MIEDRYVFCLLQMSDDDTIWIAGTVRHASLDKMSNVVDELDKIAL